MPVFALWALQFMLPMLLAGMAFMFKDVILGLLFEFLNLVSAAGGAVDVDIPTVREAFEALPPVMLETLVRIGFPEALSIIVTAVSVRAVVSLFRTIRALQGADAGL